MKQTDIGICFLCILLNFGQFLGQSEIDDDIKYAIQRNVEKTIQGKFSHFEEKNSEKYRNFVVSWNFQFKNHFETDQNNINSFE